MLTMLIKNVNIKKKIKTNYQTSLRTIKAQIKGVKKGY